MKSILNLFKKKTKSFKRPYYLYVEDLVKDMDTSTFVVTDIYKKTFVEKGMKANYIFRVMSKATYIGKGIYSSSSDKIAIEVLENSLNVSNKIHYLNVRVIEVSNPEKLNVETPYYIFK